MDELRLAPTALAELVALIEAGNISGKIGKQLLPDLFQARCASSLPALPAVPAQLPWAGSNSGKAAQAAAATLNPSLGIKAVYATACRRSVPGKHTYPRCAAPCGYNTVVQIDHSFAPADVSVHVPPSTALPHSQPRRCKMCAPRKDYMGGRRAAPCLQHKPGNCSCMSQALPEP